MDPIRYTLSFPAPHTHYVHVRAEVPAAGRDSVELSMAVWTPGSYLVGEFSRHVESVTAESPGGIALRVEKTAKNRWRVATAGALIVIVSYRVYGREMSVRTNWIESDFAFVNGAPTFLTLAAEPRRPHEVSIVPASGWTRSIRALEPAVRPTPNTTAPHTYCAPDYDTLVDSPILIGNPELYEFSVDGVPHVLANAGDTTFFDSSRVVKDLEAIVRAHKEFWGSFPYITVTCSSCAPAALRRRSSSIRSRKQDRRASDDSRTCGPFCDAGIMDAWIKLYRPDENTPNTAISYYTKGAVVAFLLDAKIRRATGGRRSLDDVMREAYARYSATHGFTPDGFRTLTEHVAGIDLGAFWRTAIEGTEELDYSEALEVFALQFRPANGSPNGKPKAWIGATTKIDASRLIVAQVKRDTPAFGAGLNVDDEIVAIDQVRVRTDRLDERLEQYTQAIASRCLWHAATVSSPSTSS